jgi:hypothetical protein
MPGNLPVSRVYANRIDVETPITPRIEKLDESDPTLQGATTNIKEGVMRLQAVPLKVLQMIALEVGPKPKRADHGLKPVVPAETWNEGAQSVGTTTRVHEKTPCLVP